MEFGEAKKSKGISYDFESKLKEAHATNLQPNIGNKMYFFWSMFGCSAQLNNHSMSLSFTPLKITTLSNCSILPVKRLFIYFCFQGSHHFYNNLSQHAAMWTFPELLPDSPNHLLPKIDIIRTKCPSWQGRNNLVVRR